MAELGIIASVVQIADLGVRLSLRLYTFGETVASADKSIISIAKDVSLASSVLRELGQTLEKIKSPDFVPKMLFKRPTRLSKSVWKCFGLWTKHLLKVCQDLSHRMERGEQ